MNASIVRLDAPLEPDVSVPGADRLLAGAPEHRVWNYFTDSTQTFFAGRWSGTRGKWRVRYTENELCVMTAGRVVITSDLGESSAFGPGDAFVVPAGFFGIIHSDRASQAASSAAQIEKTHRITLIPVSGCQYQ